MKNHRIGNDINIKWSIFSEGAPYNLEGLQVTLYLKDALGKRAVTGFSLQENNVLWRFAGKDQTLTGRYSLELVVNEGKTSMITTDICNFVNLVQHSCMIGGSDNSNIETDSISLTSDLGSVPVIIDESLSEVSENAIANKVVTIELNKKADKSAIPIKVSQLTNDVGYISSHQDISHLATKEEVEDISLVMSQKQDKISDLDAIRRGAQRGSTALQEIPEEYVNDKELDDALRPKVNRDEVATINGKSLVEGGDIVIEGGKGGATPDWNAKEGEEGYIKNKPFSLEYCKGDLVQGIIEMPAYYDICLRTSFNDIVRIPAYFRGQFKINEGPPIYVEIADTSSSSKFIQLLEDYNYYSFLEVYTNIKRIDDVFIPDTVARKSDIDSAISNAITNELNGDF